MKRSELLEQLRQLKAAYQVALKSGDAGKLMLRDLRKFCHADESCFDPDPRVHAAKEGRREVWIRISDFLTLSPEALAGFVAPDRPGADDES